LVCRDSSGGSVGLLSLLEKERILFAGDQVLPRITSNVGLYPFSSGVDHLEEIMRSSSRQATARR